MSTQQCCSIKLNMKSRVFGDFLFNLFSRHWPCIIYLQAHALLKALFCWFQSEMSGSSSAYCEVEFLCSFINWEKISQKCAQVEHRHDLALQIRWLGSNDKRLRSMQSLQTRRKTKVNIGCLQSSTFPKAPLLWQNTIISLLIL